jgi:hypothetical protein
MSRHLLPSETGWLRLLLKIIARRLIVQSGRTWCQFEAHHRFYIRSKFHELKSNRLNLMNLNVEVPSSVPDWVTTATLENSSSALNLHIDL